MKANIKTKNKTDNYNIQNMKFKNRFSFYKFLKNTKGEITKEQYEKVYTNLSGKLSIKKKTASQNKKLVFDHAETNIFFRQGIQKHNKIVEIGTEIKRRFRQMGCDEQHKVNSFIAIFENNNIKNKWNMKKRYIELFLKAKNERQLQHLFKPYLVRQDELNITNDFISEYYQVGVYKNKIKEKDCMSYINEDRHNNYLQQLQKKLKSFAI